MPDMFTVLAVVNMEYCWSVVCIVIILYWTFPKLVKWQLIFENMDQLLIDYIFVMLVE